MPLLRNLNPNFSLTTDFFSQHRRIQKHHEHSQNRYFCHSVPTRTEHKAALRSYHEYFIFKHLKPYGHNILNGARCWTLIWPPLLKLQFLLLFSTHVLQCHRHGNVKLTLASFAEICLPKQVHSLKIRCESWRDISYILIFFQIRWMSYEAMFIDHIVSFSLCPRGLPIAAFINIRFNIYF